VDNIRELIGEEVIERFFANRYRNEKLRQNVPDGVYDRHGDPVIAPNAKWRDVIIDGFVMWTCTKKWLDTGGPPEWPADLRVPWGVFLEKNR
jgi:hypothetical protein